MEMRVPADRQVIRGAGTGETERAMVSRFPATGLL